MKLLFTSIGRRVELIQAFRKAGDNLSIPLTIIGADVTNSAPALYFCDAQRIVPRILDEQYIPALLNICKCEAVDCLIPTIDTDLNLLAEYKSKFESIGTKVLISSVDKVEICQDKNLTAKYFQSLGLNTPKTYDQIDAFEEDIKNGLCSFPAFIKPKNGSSSINAYRVNDFDDLKIHTEQIKDYIIQPFISGDEYTIDICCDYSGNPVYITPRKRLAIRAGEVLKTQISQDERMISDMKILIEDFKPCGPITVQLIRDSKTGIDYYIEINPRFGGGAPLSAKAGADSPAALLEILNGKNISYINNAAKDKTIYCRFDQSICVSE